MAEEWVGTGVVGTATGNIDGNGVGMVDGAARVATGATVGPSV